MNTYARITDGVAVEVWTDGGLGIVPADVFVPGLAEQFEPVPEGVQAGWSLIDGVWTAPPEAPTPSSIPQEVSMRQAKVALFQMGMLAQINSIIESSSDEILKLEWQYAQTVKRSWPTLPSLAQQIPLTDEDIDNLFILADSL